MEMHVRWSDLKYHIIDHVQYVYSKVSMSTAQATKSKLIFFEVPITCISNSALFEQSKILDICTYKQKGVIFLNYRDRDILLTEPNLGFAYFLNTAN